MVALSHSVSGSAEIPHWTAHRVVVFHGQADTHIKTGEDYETLSLEEVFALQPSDKAKARALSFIPSSYCGHDARAHAVQQTQGSFVALTGDIDKGDHDLAKVLAEVVAVVGGAAFSVFSSSNARPGNMRWRIIIPLSAPCDFATWNDAQNALFDQLDLGGLPMDRALARAGQPVFLPNVPATHAASGEPLRGEFGEPLYFASRSQPYADGLDLNHGPIAEAMKVIVAKRRADDELRERIRVEAARKRQTRAAGDDESLIDAFGRANAVADLLQGYGYQQSPRNADDWRSPNQTGDTFATRIVGTKWISLSESDADAGLGTRHAAGCYGDAYDLLVHYEHGGDHRAAFRTLGEERRAAGPYDYGEPPRPVPQSNDNDNPDARSQGESSHMREGFSATTGDTIPPLEDPTLSFLDLAELSKTSAKPKRFAIPKLAPEGEVTLFTGGGSAGKSLLAQQLCTAAAAGVPCLGFEIEQMSAIYITCEDDVEQLHWRQEHICAALGVRMADLAGKLHLASLRGALDNNLLVFNPNGTTRLAVAYRRLEAAIRNTGARIAFLDNVAHLFTGNENDRGEVTGFINALNRLAGETGAAIIILGHPNKSGDAYSGSTAWLNAVRSQFMVEHDLETDMRTLTIGKANYARKGDQVRFFWKDWAFVTEDQMPADFAADLAQSIKVSRENDIFLACLRARMSAPGREVGPSLGPNYAPSRFAEMTEAKGVSKQSFVRAMERLFHIGMIETQQMKRKGSDTKTIIIEVAKP